MSDRHLVKRSQIGKDRNRDRDLNVGDRAHALVLAPSSSDYRIEPALE